MTILSSPKKGYFPKGLTHGFGQKIQNFSSLFFSKIALRTESPSILSRKDRSDSAGRVIYNRSLVGKYNLLKRNSPPQKTMRFIGVEAEQETSATPPKKNPRSAPAS